VFLWWRTTLARELEAWAILYGPKSGELFASEAEAKALTSVLHCSLRNFEKSEGLAEPQADPPMPEMSMPPAPPADAAVGVMPNLLVRGPLPVAPNDQMLSNLRRAATELGGGDAGRAAQALQSQGMRPLTASTRQQLDDLYPPEHPGDADLVLPENWDVSIIPKDAFTSRIIAAIIDSKAPTSGADGLGWTWLSLKRLLEPGDALADTAATTLADIAYTIACGRYTNTSAAAVLAAGRGVALAKGDTGIRPIGIRPLLTTMAGKGLMLSQRVKDAIPSAVGAHQHACGTPGGSEIPAHVIAAFLETEDATALALDVKNAYNSLSRRAIFEAVRDKLPWLLPMTVMLDLTNYIVTFDGDDAHPAHTVTVRRGVPQGDTRSSAIFCAAMEPIIRAIREAHPDTFIIAIADDTTVTGKGIEPLRTIPTFATLLAGIGLTLQRPKCGAFNRDIDSIQHECVIQGVTAKHDGLVICGTPLGTPAFVDSHLRTKVGETESLLRRVQDALATFKQQQTENGAYLIYKMIDWCIVPMINHLLRSVPPRLMLPHARRFDSLIYDFVTRLVELDPNEDGAAGTITGTTAQLIMHLSRQLGGLGLASAERRAPYAYLASLALVGVPALRHLNEAFFDVHERADVFFPDAAANLGQLQLSSNPEVRDWTTIELLQAEQPKLQAALNNGPAGRAEQWQALESRLMDTPAGRQQLADVISQGEEGAAWLAVSLRKTHLHLSNAEFIVLVRHRIGLPVIREPKDPPIECDACTGHLDARGDHAFRCTHRFAAFRNNRHTAALTCFLRIFREKRHRPGVGERAVVPTRMPALAGVWAAKDATRPLDKNGIPSNICTYGDGIIKTPANLNGAEDSLVVVDVTVAHLDAGRVKGLAKRGTYAAGHHAWAEKHALYAKYWHITALRRFEPLVLTTGGSWHPRTRLFVADYLRLTVGGIPKQWTAAQHKLFAQYMNEATESVGVALQRVVARTLLHANVDHARQAILGQAADA